MGQSEIIEILGKGAAVVGIVVAFGYALTMIGVFVRGLGVAQNTGSVSETVPYITALVLLMVVASLPVWLDIDIPA
jgi:hypothetical protein